MDESPRGQAMSWTEAPPPVFGLAAAATVSMGAIAADTALSLATWQPGVVLDWLPVAAAGAFLVALRFGGAVRQAALTATIAFLALFPLLNPSPEPWMYAAPLAAVALALGVALTPTARAVAALPALAGMLAMLELLADAGAATLLGTMAFAAYLLALWLELPSVALPSVALPSRAPAADAFNATSANPSGEES